MAVNLYKNKTLNSFKTWAFLAFFLGLVIAAGWAASFYFGSPLILYLAVILAVLINFASFWWGHKWVLKMSRAQKADAQEWRELHRIVENLAIAAGLPKPEIYIIKAGQPNAFATGRSPQHAVVAVTTGLLEQLDRKELEGVLAHELAHIGNRDMLITTIAVILAGFVAIVADIALRSMFFGFGGRHNSRGNTAAIAAVIALILIILAPLFATLLRLAISRKREFLADSTGALITRFPEGLASALRKISQYPEPLKTANSATASLYFANPFRGQSTKKFMHRLFSTHPPVEERIKALTG
jgi:heat shock protein HtpX